MGVADSLPRERPTAVQETQLSGNPVVVRGNNVYGSAGTLKCSACRMRHKKVTNSAGCSLLSFQCVLPDSSTQCVYCTKNNLECVVEYAPKASHGLFSPEPLSDRLKSRTRKLQLPQMYERRFILKKRRGPWTCTP